MILLVDGYNVTKCAEHLLGGRTDSLELERERLLKLLIHYRDRKPGIKEIIVFFDSRFPSGIFSKSTRQGISVRFSDGRTADEEIISYLEMRLQRTGSNRASANVSDCYVVTDDKAVYRMVGAMGGQHLSVEKMIGRLKPETLNQQKRPTTGKVRTKKLSGKKAEVINEELRQIWNID